MTPVRLFKSFMYSLIGVTFYLYHAQPSGEDWQVFYVIITLCWVGVFILIAWAHTKKHDD